MTNQNPTPEDGITHWANPEHSETITADMKVHNLSLGGAAAAAVARYTIALGPIVRHPAEAERLRDQAKRALFEAEQTYPGIADRPEMQALRELLGLGEAPPPEPPYGYVG